MAVIRELFHEVDIKAIEKETDADIPLFLWVQLERFKRDRVACFLIINDAYFDGHINYFQKSIAMRDYYYNSK